MTAEAPRPHGDARADLTWLVRAAGGGDVDASAELFSRVYSELRQIAQRYMSAERRDHTLQATALVHEAYMRLLAGSSPDWESRAQFFFAAAQAMRRILIEHARAKGRIKRGGEPVPASAGAGPPARRRLPEGALDLVTGDNPDEFLMFEDAVCRLERVDPQAGRTVRLRFYAGLSVDETAAALGVSASTVDRDWAFARAWLYKALGENG